jgi:hypothetical protein
MKLSVIYRLILVVALSAGLSQLPVNAGEVSRDQASIIAGQVVSRYFPAGIQSSSANIRIAPDLKTNDPFYVCHTGASGFVLVAKNDDYPPVLGFSWESNFPEHSGQLPETMNAILDNIRTQCAEYAVRDELKPSIQERWKSFSGTKGGSTVGTGIISPLLATSWNSDTTYFELFPKSFRKGGSVAIAMAQVFRFFGEPNSGTGRFCYVLNGYGELCTEFNTASFRFDRMSNTTGNPAVDSLVYYMAVSCTMQPEGASLNSFTTTLPVHFGYSPDMRMIEAWEYPVGEVIRHQLSMRRPVPAEWIGHSFVIDGYFPDNLFHFNMGWGGDYNGFYLIDNTVVTVETDHSLLNCFIDFHPKSFKPVPTNIQAAEVGDSIRISWNSNLNDSLQALLVRFVVLRDGLIPVVQTTGSSVVVSPEMMGGSASLRVVADFGLNGGSELSEPFLYISDRTVTDIPSINLRQKLNTMLGYTDLLRQPFVGELQLIKDIEISFPDQRGLEKLTSLKSLRVDGAAVNNLRDGDYLQNLKHLRFYHCQDFDFSIFGHTRSLQQLYGYDFTPFDLYDFRHNTDLGLIHFLSTGSNPNMLMDLFGADKYFPKIADYFLYHMNEGPGASISDCYVSYETYNEVYPKIKSNLNLYVRTKPSTFAPCYPTPARNVNIPEVSRLSWQANANNEAGVYYNVFVGQDRTHLELVSVFQTDTHYDGVFDQDREYYWRVEAYHADSTYYSGIYRFSTWQDMPIPFIDRFDEYYTACDLAVESPFWTNFDNTLDRESANQPECQVGRVLFARNEAEK